AHRALECAARGVTPAEQALVTAIAARYPAPAPPVDAAGWDEGYARAMRRAHVDHPGDLDIAALFADALMNVTPWPPWGLRARSRRAHPGGDAGPGAGARTAGGHGASGRAAHVHPPDGDVAPPRARPPGGRRAARAGSRWRSPAAHADPHRRAVRGLPAGRR